MIDTLDYTTLKDTNAVLDWHHNMRGIYAYMQPADPPGHSLPIATHESGRAPGVQALSGYPNVGLLMPFAAQRQRLPAGKWDGGRILNVHQTRE